MSVDDHAKRAHVVQLGKIEFLAAHLFPDAVDVLRTAAHLGLDLRGCEFGLQARDRARHIDFALDALFVEQLRDALVGGWVFEAEREVFELPLQLPDAETIRERRVDFERLARHVRRRLRSCAPRSNAASARRDASRISTTRMSCANASNILRSASTCARRAACASRPVSGSTACVARELTEPSRASFRTSQTSACTSGAEALADRAPDRRDAAPVRRAPPPRPRADRC